MPRVAAILNDRIVRHGWIGSCVAVTGIMTKILDRLGIWNVPIIGSASIYADGHSRHFAIFDENEGPGFERGHMWIAAPPYDVVDPTLHHQRWGADSFRNLIPTNILGERLETFNLRPKDVMSPMVFATYGRSRPVVTQLLSEQRRITAKFPPRRLVIGTTEIRWVPGGIRVPDSPLEVINSSSRSGVPGIRIWEEDIVPAFGLAR